MAKQIKQLDIPDLDQTLTPDLLGRAIKARRTQNQLRIEDAAALCGVAKQTFMKIEHGNAASQFGSILQICSALGIQLRILPWRQEDEVSDDWQ